MIKLRINNKFIEFVSVNWSGTDNQCSRQVDFTLAHNPYDKNFEQVSIFLGDIVYLYNDDKIIFLGTVTSREKTAEIGTASYTAMDFMQHLLRSSGSYKFKKTTPEKVTKKLCNDLKIKVGSLAKTNCKLPKMFFDEQNFYDIIIAVYRKAKAQTGKKYMPIMQENKLSVIEKGTDSGVVLKQGDTITAATYTDNTDNITNKVIILSESGKKLGKVENKKSTAKYGIYQAVIKKEKGADAKKAAKAQLNGLEKEASVEAIGNINAVSGKSIKINDSATGLVGIFYISSDTHTFENGVHTMSLELKFKNEMEEGAESEITKDKKELTNSAKCYYLESGSVFHSNKNCKACKGKSLKTSTVSKVKKIKVAKGKNKGKRKYKACSKCWSK